MPTNRLAATLLAATLASAAVAQTTHTVGPGGFATLAAAVTVAVPGDIVLLQPGTYTTAGINILAKGLTIRAVTSGTATIVGPLTINVPAPETLHLVGVVTNGLFVVGRMTADDCKLGHQFSNLGSPAVGASAATLVLQDCEVGDPGTPYLRFGFASGLNATDSTVTATGCTFRGLDFEPQFGSGGHSGVWLANSTLVASGCTITAGDGRANASGAPGIGLRADAASRVYLADSSVQGGRAVDLPGMPITGCAIDASVGRLGRCTLTPNGCALPTPPNGPVFAATRSAPPVANAPFSLSFRGEPNRAIGVFAAFSLQGLTVPVIEQPVLLGASAFPLALLLADQNGDAGGTWTLPPNVQNQQLWLQALEDGAAPLQLAPVVGGVVR